MTNTKLNGMHKVLAVICALAGAALMGVGTRDAEAKSACSHTLCERGNCRFGFQKDCWYHESGLYCGDKNCSLVE
jgi:hypothetical protein